MKFTLEPFVHKKAEEEKLLEYGFKKEGDFYVYSFLMKKDFKVIWKVKDGFLFSMDAVDTVTEEPYVLLDTELACGKFISSLRTEYLQKAGEVISACFSPCYCSSLQAERILDEIHRKYGILPSFPFKGKDRMFPVLTHEDGTWFSLIMEVSKDTLYPSSKEKEIMNLKAEKEKIPVLLKRDGIYPAYHMNKSHWISLSLDERLSDDEIMSLVDDSYLLTKKDQPSSEWVYPSNPKTYPLEEELDKYGKILWQKNKSTKKGDIVYLYSGLPDGCLLYKTMVSKDDCGFDTEYGKETMELTLLEKYDKSFLPFAKLKTMSLTSIRGPRRIPKELSDYLKNRVVEFQ